MIATLLLNLILTILSTILEIVGANLPNINIGNYIAQFLLLITRNWQTIVNFIHFMLGDSMYAFLIFAIGMLTYTYLIFPIIVLVRRVIIKGGDT